MIFDPKVVFASALEQGVVLYLEDGLLKYKAEKGALSVELKQRLIANKVGIIKHLTEIAQNKRGPVLPQIETCSRQQRIPLSYSQQRLWFVEQLDGPSLQFNMPGHIRLKGLLDIVAVKQALSALLQRHEVLRTHFTIVSGEACQCIAEDYQLPLLEYDLSDLDSEAQLKRVNELKELEARTPFDLSQDLMLRMRVIKLTEESHLVLYTMHHIAGDGWSLGIFNQEFARLYEAFCQGHENPLQDLKVQYADYAFWQRNWLQGEVLEQQLRYWREHLAGIPVVHSLPQERPRPEHQESLGRRLSQMIDKHKTRIINALCDKHDVTLYMFLQTVFALLLSRYSHQEDIVMGSPMAGRTHSDIENLIGFFINTLVLRTRVDQQLTFSELLKANKETILDAYAHQHIPFEMLVEELSPERNLSHNPITQISFTLQNNERVAFELQEQDVKSVGQGKGVNSTERINIKHELALFVEESNNGMSFTWVYNDSLFSGDIIRGMMSSFEILLDSIIESLSDNTTMQKTVAELPMLSAIEAQQQKLWNDTAVPYPQDLCIHQLIENMAEKQPHKVALSHECAHISYAALEQRANQLTHYLRANGVKNKSLVGVCVNRSFDMVISVLAILKTGAAYVALDPALPEARLEHMIRESDIATVITNEALKAAVPRAEHIDLFPLDGEEQQDAIKCQPLFKAPLIDVTPDDLAYVVYTSGSTGRPKGVMAGHRGVVNYLNYIRKTFSLDTRDRILQFASLSFDASVRDLLGPLSAGAQVVLMNEETAKTPDLIWPLLERQSISGILSIVPSMLRSLLDATGKPNHQRPLNSNSKMRLLLCSGEALSMALCAHAKQLFGEQLLLVNQYGPTECTMTSSFHIVDESSSHKDTALIGRPIPNMQAWVLDSLQQLVPIGAPGELYLGGVGLAKGYLQQKQLSDAKFISNPLQASELNKDASADKLYRTGDLVRHTADGQLQFLGRIDNQIKIRGQRVEPGEIENVLLKHEFVDSSAVIAYDDNNTGQQLVAGVVSAAVNAQKTDDYNVSTTEQAKFKSTVIQALKTHLATFLPAHMIPAFYVFLDKMPLTANGKVDKQYLLRQTSEYENGTFAAPRNAIEERLSDLWRELLDIDSVSIHDSFFALGGHSLLAIRLMSMVREIFAAELAVHVIFESPTIATLGECISTKIAESDNSELLPRVELADRSKPLPLSYAQQRLWTLDQIGEGSTQYNMTGRFPIKGEFNNRACERAIGSIIQRHEVLRSRFQNVDGTVSQQVAEDFAVPLEHHNLASVEQEAKAQLVSQIATQEAQRTFDLTQDLLLRVNVLTLSEQQHVFLYTMHHIASDGWSIRIFQNEFDALYTAYSQGQADPLPPLQRQYVDYAVWQRDWLQGEVLTKHLDFWQTRLANLPAVHSLPLDRPRPAKQTHDGRLVYQILDEQTSASLNSICEKYNVTLFMFLHTVFALLLGRYSNEDDIVIASPVAGRVHRDTEALIGFFVNTVVLRTQLGQHSSFQELLEENKQAILNAYEHQNMPFDKLVDELNPERDPGYNPLAQVYFVVQNTERGVFDQSALESSKVGAKSRISNGKSTQVKFELELTVTEMGTGLLLAWGYNEAIFDNDSVQRMAANYGTMLNSIVNSLQLGEKDCLLNEIELLQKREMSLLLETWNETGTNNSELSAVHRQFELQADKTPDAIALIYAGSHISYRELNRRANLLANMLVQAGTPLEARIGVCMERSPDMVASMMAILKAGGCYVPLDSSYPMSRLTYMVQDSAIQLLLTDSKTAVALDLGQLLADEGSNALHTAEVIDVTQQVLSFSQPAGNPDVDVDPRNLAYVIYTSGSTGVPKGVMGLHGNLANRVNWLNNAIGVISDDVFCQKTRIGFVDHVAELLQPLLSGVPSVILSAEVVQDPELLATAINNSRVSQLTLVPSLLRMLLTCSQTMPELKKMYTSGEALNLQDVAAFTQCFPQVRLFNLYGSTEVGADVTACEVNLFTGDVEELSGEAAINCSRSNKLILDTQLPQENTLVPSIGMPIDNSQAYILDDKGLLAPLGVTGELYIGGTGLARGYLNKASLTAAQFVPDPFSKEPGARLYRTGDRVKYMKTGLLNYLGRSDSQIKVRGIRVETGEIERALQEQDSVKEALVQLLEKEKHDGRLVAYIVDAQQDGWGDKQQNRSLYKAHLEKSLPDYMVPRAFVFLDSLPLTPNGKIDKLALPTPADSDFIQEKFVAPRSEIESTLCVILQTTLKLERVGVQDNFFAIGVNSFLSTKLIAQIRQHFDIELPASAMFESPTIESLARIIQQSTVKNTVPAEKLPSAENYNISFLQKLAWVNNQISLSEKQNSFFLQAVKQLTDADFDKVVAALNIVLQRHEIFRTTINLVDQTLRQTLHEFVPVQLDDVLVDVSGAKLIGQEIDRIKKAELNHTVDMSKLNLFRVKLIKANKICSIVFTVDHVCIDARSLAVFEGEFNTVYQALVSGKQPVLAPLKFDFKEYSQWEYEEIYGANSDSHKAYWHSLLGKNADAFCPLRYFSDTVPQITVSYRDLFKHQTANLSDRVDPHYPELAFGTVRHIFLKPRKTSRYQFSVAETTYKRLKKFTAETEVMFSVSIIASISVLLEKLTGKEKSVLTVLSDTRIHNSFADIMGCFVNDVFLLSEVKENACFKSLCDDVARQLAASHEHKVYPASMIASELDLSIYALQTIQINFIEQTEKQIVHKAPAHFEHGISDMGIHLDIREHKNGLFLDCQYPRELFTCESIDKIMGYYASLLERIAESAEQPIARLPGLPGYPKQQGSDARIVASSAMPANRLNNTTTSNVGRKLAVVEERDYYPVSVEQTKAWVNSQIRLAYGVHSHFVQRMVHFEDMDNYTLNRLDKALNSLLRRFEILRTTVHLIDGELKQKIHAYEKIDFKGDAIDISDSDNKLSAINNIKAKICKRTVDLSKLYPFAFKIVVLSKERCAVLLTLDHVCVDMRAMNRIESQLQNIYQDQLMGQFKEGIVDEYSYKDYAQWEHDQLRGEQGQRHFQYWQSLLQNNLDAFNPVRYFWDYPDASSLSYKESFANQISTVADTITEPHFPEIAFGATRSIYTAPLKAAGYLMFIDGDLFNGVKKLAVKNKVMFSTLLIASVNILLKKLSDKDKSIISVFSDTRVLEELHEMIGCFTNDILFLGEARNTDNLKTVCQRVTEQIHSSYEHKVYPMMKVLSEMDVSLARLRTVRVDYTEQNGKMDNIGTKHVGGGIAEIGINLKLTAFEDGMRIDCRYLCSLFGPEKIESVMQYYRSLLKELLPDNRKTLAQLSNYKEFLKVYQS